MPLYIALVNWTEQGIRNFRDSGRRAEDYCGLVEQHGSRVPRRRDGHRGGAADRGRIQP
jgi:uncharacterized protein with GYD domain